MDPEHRNERPKPEKPAEGHRYHSPGDRHSREMAVAAKVPRFSPGTRWHRELPLVLCYRTEGFFFARWRAPGRPLRQGPHERAEALRIQGSHTRKGAAPWQRRRFILSESEMPTHWYNIAADLQEPAAAAAAPRHAPADRPGRTGAALPDGPHRAGGEPASAASRSPTRCARSTSSGGPRRSSARVAWRRPSARRAHIYYKDEGVTPAGSPQAEHGRAAGVLQQAGRHHAPDHRDRRRPVGQRRWRSPATCSASSARSTWSRSATTRSRIAAR